MPNILLYVLDSLRPDHLSCYGYPRNTSPNIDRLAAEGVLFENAFAQATWTRPSAGALFTGCYPPVHRAITMEDALSPDILTLPGWLKAKGYYTAAISTIPQISPATGFSRDYDEFHDIATSGNNATAARADEINDIAIPWLAKYDQSRFFLMVWAVDPHAPYFFPHSSFGFFKADTETQVAIQDLSSIKRANGAKDVEGLIDAYDSAILFSDQQLGIILEKLRQQGIYEDTMIIVMGDHGEIFDEHRRTEQWSMPGLGNLLSKLPRLNTFRLAGNIGWLGHLAVLPYDEVIHVPLIVKFPYGWNGGKIVSSMVQLIDIFPTIAEIVSNSASLLSVQGESLTSWIENDTQKADRYSFSFSQQYPETAAYVSVRNAEWKYIQVRYPPITWQQYANRLKFSFFTTLERWMLGQELLFNLSKDPDEDRNVVHQYSDVRNKFRRALADWDKANATFTNRREDVEFDEAIVKRLRDLGYL